MPGNNSTSHINASVQTTHDALTKPDLVRQWQFGDDMVSDWKAGNDIGFSTHWEGSVFEKWGKVIEFRPGEIRHS